MIVLIVSLLALISGEAALVFPLSTDAITREIFLNITIPGLNGGEPFPVRLDSHGYGVIDARLFNGDHVPDSDSIILTSVDGRNVEVTGYHVQYLIEPEHGGYIGIGPGSSFISQLGPVDVVYGEELSERMLLVNSTNFSDTFCMAESVLSIPLRYNEVWNHHVIPLAQFKLILNGNDGARGILASEPLFPEAVSISSPGSYMSVPMEIAETLADMITMRGGTVIHDTNTPFTFRDCGPSLVETLPHMIISISDELLNFTGEIVQLPEDYLMIDHYRQECSYRFTLTHEDALLSINPLFLNGINTRIDLDRITLCDPLL